MQSAVGSGARAQHNLEARPILVELGNEQHTALRLCFKDQPHKGCQGAAGRWGSGGQHKQARVDSTSPCCQSRAQGAPLITRAQVDITKEEECTALMGRFQTE